MSDEKKNQAKKAVAVPIRWEVPESIITRFAAHMVIQTIENEFKISFFELKPKIGLLRPAQPATEVVAECVSSIIVTPDRMPKFIAALQAHLEAFVKSRAPK